MPDLPVSWNGVTIRRACELGLMRNLNGQRFVFTGKLSIRRTDLENLVVWLGGSPVRAVTSSTNFLVNGSPSLVTSSKFKAALDKGVPILSEDEFLEYIISKEVREIYGL